MGEERKSGIVSSHLVLGESFVVFWFLLLGAAKLAKTSKAHIGKAYQSWGIMLFFGKHEEVWKKREITGQLCSVV